MADCIYDSPKIKKRKNLVKKDMRGDKASYNKVEYFPLITAREDDAANFSMRLFKIHPEGFTGKHKHSYEHEVYVLKGSGYLFIDSEKLRIERDDCFIIHPYELHQLIADKEGLEFICIVPNRYKNQPE